MRDSQEGIEWQETLGWGWRGGGCCQKISISESKNVHALTQLLLALLLWCGIFRIRELQRVRCWWGFRRLSSSVRNLKEHRFLAHHMCPTQRGGPASLAGTWRERTWRLRGEGINCTPAEDRQKQKRTGWHLCSETRGFVFLSPFPEVQGCTLYYSNVICFTRLYKTFVDISQIFTGPSGKQFPTWICVRTSFETQEIRIASERDACMNREVQRVYHYFTSSVCTAQINRTIILQQIDSSFLSLVERTAN